VFERGGRWLGHAFGVVTLSLVLNLVVLVPVCVGLLRGGRRMTAVFGDSTPARSILLSIYLAIGMASACALVWPRVEMIAMLLGLQVVYKLTTPFTVGTLRNPVVVSNVGIAVVHGATLVSLGLA
jgi:hypothetical protein